jgi:tRNA-specific 2-thiouridylase
VDEQGEVLGQHTGAYGFTVGQRKGLHLGRPAPDGRPRYVLDVQPATGTVVVGSAERLDVDRIRALRPRWCGATPAGPVEVLAQVRAHGEAVAATAEVVEGARGLEVDVRLHRPVRGVAPGQSVVLYDGTRVVGSATISGTARA